LIVLVKTAMSAASYSHFLLNCICIPMSCQVL
jgi:hypothetical protein